MDNFIRLIDDEATEREVYKRHLERGKLLDIEEIDPKIFTKIKDCDRLLMDDVKAIIIDQNIAATSGIPFDGLDIAEYLRGLNNMIPIFILTNFEPEMTVLDKHWCVDNIITKDDFNSDEGSRTNIQRILRAIGRYDDALSSKMKEFGVLIEKKVSGTINVEEEDRLKGMKLEFERVTAVKEGEYIEDMAATTKSLEEAKKILQNLKDMGC